MLIEEFELHAVSLAKLRNEKFLKHELLIKLTFAVCNHELRHRYFVNINILVLHTREIFYWARKYSLHGNFRTQP